MASRFALALLAIAFVAALFVPATVAAADEPADDAALTLGDGVDAIGIDRLRTTVTTPTPARGGEGSPNVPLDRAPRGVDREQLLAQSTREAVYERIHESPGETLSGIADVVGVTKSTVRYHVRVLRDAGLVEATEAAGALRVAPADANVELVAVLNAPGTGAVLEAVAEHEPVSVTDLAESTDRAPSTVSHHLSTLEGRGLVERERAGESVVTRLAPATRAALAPDQPVPADD